MGAPGYYLSRSQVRVRCPLSGPLSFYVSVIYGTVLQHSEYTPYRNPFPGNRNPSAKSCHKIIKPLTVLLNTFGPG